MAITYPEAFKDKIGGEVVASGYDYLIKQLMSKIDNLKREKTTLAPKRQAAKSVSNMSNASPTKNVRLDSYGCVNWLPEKLPHCETTETQKQTQDELKKMHRETGSDITSFVRKMEVTFFCQRKDIVGGMEVDDLIKEWPYL